MEFLTTKEQNDLIKDVMRPDGFSRDVKKRIASMKRAALKFGLKISTSKKGTYWEKVILHTDYNNCNEVQDYISRMGISVPIICGKIEISPNK